ncbi:hypothetical protein L914_14264 [Phytophthora nicotianae]|uniref:DDE Tnp4 domain-containing protein n=1 Tax=Phytophthora nicotianae TaxID=4792 RepID=W2MT84_PHYNI|nr:hypothetical protein L914_14264 [Phytophthora nicotianae]
MAPDGLFIDFYGPCVGRRHGPWQLRQSGLLNILPHVLNDGDNTSYCIYGDPACPLKPNLQVGFKGSKLTEAQNEFNAAMSKLETALLQSETLFLIGNFALVQLMSNAITLLKAAGVILLLFFAHASSRSLVRPA